MRAGKATRIFIHCAAILVISIGLVGCSGGGGGSASGGGGQPALTWDSDGWDEESWN